MDRLFGFIPYLFLIALAVGIVMWFVYNKMPHGKYMYATVEMSRQQKFPA